MNDFRRRVQVFIDAETMARYIVTERVSETQSWATCTPGDHPMNEERPIGIVTACYVEKKVPKTLWERICFWKPQRIVMTEVDRIEKGQWGYVTVQTQSMYKTPEDADKSPE